MLELFVIYKRLNNTYSAQRCSYLKVTNNIVSVEKPDSTPWHFSLDRLVAVIPVDLSAVPAANIDYINDSINYNLSEDTTNQTKEPTSHEQEEPIQNDLSAKVRSFFSHLLRRDTPDPLPNSIKR